MDRQEQDQLEGQIRQALQQNDLRRAAERIVEGYGPQLLGYLIHTMRQEADASEVFSQFCEELLRALERFEGRSSVRTWAYRLATRLRGRWWKDPYRRRTQRLATDEISRLEQQVRSQTLPYLRSELQERFALMRAQLDPEEQSLLTLRLDKGMSWPEIAEILAGGDGDLLDEERRSKAASLRQRFKRLKDKIRELAREQGLLDVPD